MWVLNLLIIYFLSFVLLFACISVAFSIVLCAHPSAFDASHVHVQLNQEVMLLKSLFAALPVLKNRAQHYETIFALILVHLKAGKSYDWNCKKMIKSG
jgi:hypothetical protein